MVSLSDGVHQSAKVEQLTPVAVVARQTRDLDAEHRANPAQAYFGDQALEALTCGAPGARLAKVVINLTTTSFQPSVRACSAS
jgi:hypothetical protein